VVRYYRIEVIVLYDWALFKRFYEKNISVKEFIASLENNKHAFLGKIEL